MPGTTANYGFRYQLPADPPDGAALGKNLAEDVDAAMLAQLTALRPLVNQRSTASAGITTTTLADVLTVTLPAAGTYTFQADLPVTQTTAVGRCGLNIGGTSTPTAWRWMAGAVQYNNATNQGAVQASGTTYGGATSGVPLSVNDWAASAGFCWVHVNGLVTVSAAGTLTIRLSQSSGSGTITALAGAIMQCWRSA